MTLTYAQIDDYLPNEEIVRKRMDFAFPLTQLPFLLFHLEKCLKDAVREAQNQGQNQSIEKVYIHLFHEYEKKYQLVELELESNHFDMGVLFDLLEFELLNIDLNNPVNAFEVEVFPRWSPKSSSSAQTKYESFSDYLEKLSQEFYMNENDTL